MSYRQDGFNLWIVVDGNEQRIINGTVRVPFNTEYAIRVRNDNPCRALFDIEIDGFSSSESYVIEAYQTVTIERFMNGNLGYGSKFKFVEATNSSVQDPKSPSNGKITVSIRKEASLPKVTKPQPRQRLNSVRTSSWGEGPIGTSCPSCNYWNSDFYSSPVNLNNITFTSDVGATIDGSFSGQSFVLVNGFTVESTPIILSLYLRGIEFMKTTNPCGEVALGKPTVVNFDIPFRYCPACGNKYNSSNLKIKYCETCGHKVR